VSGPPPIAVLAVSDGRVALAEAAASYEGNELPRPAQNGAVEVRGLEDGELIARVFPAGTVRALALSGARLAVLVEATDASKSIEVYVVPGGELLSSASIGPDAEPVLGIAGRRLVYQVGRDVHLVDADSGSDELLWHAVRSPVGLSIEGRRVAWAQSSERTGSVVAVTLPPESPERIALRRR
jgi:hypothetical protein